MAEPTTTSTITNFLLSPSGIMLIMVGAVAIGFFILYRKFRPVPKQPDFVQTFGTDIIESESMNKIMSTDVKFLYRGDQKLGKIISRDTQKYNYEPTKEEQETKQGIIGFEKNIATIVYYTGMIFRKKKLLYFIPETDKPKTYGNKLVFHSDTGFTAIGSKIYATKTSYPFVAEIVDAEYSKRLYGMNVNIGASKMAHISAETPEMAHELALKRIEIEKIRAEKEKKVSELI